MPSSSAGGHDTTLKAKMPIQDLDNALSQALKAAESAAEATTRGLKAALASCDVKTQKAFEASQCSAQAARDSIKSALSTLKAARLERGPWTVAYQSFMKKVQRYWRFEPQETSIPAKRQRDGSPSTPAASTSEEEDEEEQDPRAYWTQDGNLEGEGHPGTKFRPTFDDRFGLLRLFRALGNPIDDGYAVFSFQPPSRDVLVRLTIDEEDYEDRWLVVPSRCPFAAWAPREES